MFKKIVASKSGEMYIEAVITLMVVVVLLLFSISALGISPVNNTADMLVDQLIEQACFNGCFGSEFQKEVAELEKQYSNIGLKVKYGVCDEKKGDPAHSIACAECTAKYYNSTLQRVQLGGKMWVTVYYEFSLMGLPNPIELSTSRVGASENYWKTETLP